MRFSLFKKREKPFLVLDIGTEAVKALLLKKENDKLVVLNNSLQYFKKYSIFESNDFEAEFIKKAISKSLEKIFKEKKNLKNIPVLVSLPADILKAKIISQCFKRDKESKISKSEERSIVKEILSKSKKQISYKFAQKYGILKNDIHWTNFKIAEVKVNGYPISDIQGCQGKDLEINVLAIFLAKDYFEKVKRIFESLNLKIFKIIHLAEIFQDNFYKGIKNGLFIDIGGEITQAFLIENSNLKQLKSFEFGGQEFSQELSETLGIDQESARSLKERYANNLLTEKVRIKIKEMLVSEKKIWQQYLENVIRGTKITSDTWIFGGSSLLPEIRESIRRSKIIYPKSLKNIKDPIKSLKGPQYITALLIARYGQEIL